jgi:hypothetical protein
MTRLVQWEEVLVQRGQHGGAALRRAQQPDSVAHAIADSGKVVSTVQWQSHVYNSVENDKVRTTV